MNSLYAPARRLPWLLALSGCIHLLLLLPPLQRRPIEIAPASRAPIALRLAVPAAPLPRPAPKAARPRGPAPVAPPAIAARTDAPAPLAAPAATGAEAAAVALTEAGTLANEVAPSSALEQTPQYALMRPEARALEYEVHAEGAGAAGTATLALAYSEDGYTLRQQGAADELGQWSEAQVLTSEGVLTDGAFAPLRASAGRSGLPAAQISLNHAYAPQAGEQEGAAATSRLVHDRASLMMQLIGMGLHDPGQFEQPVHIAVASSDGVATLTFTLAGQEDIRVAAGTFPTWHLVQEPAASGAGLEVWLAPELGWFPVQIKTRTPSGAVVVQRLLRAGKQ